MARKIIIKEYTKSDVLCWLFPKKIWSIDKWISESLNNTLIFHGNATSEYPNKIRKSTFKNIIELINSSSF